MAEQVYRWTRTDEKTIERVLQDEHAHINHMVLPRGEGFPEHVANADVYMAVIRGRLSITLNGREPHAYGTGDILKIPYGTRMQGINPHRDILEMIVVKVFPQPTGA